MASRRAIWTHEFNTKTHLREAFRGFFDMPKILAPLMKLLPQPEKVHRRPYDGLRCPHEWPVVFTIRAEIENFYHRVSIFCLLRDSVTPALVVTVQRLISDTISFFRTGSRPNNNIFLNVFFFFFLNKCFWFGLRLYVPSNNF